MFSLPLTLAAARYSKERPNHRRTILRMGLRPHPSVEAWDGGAVDPQGTLVPMEGTMRTQSAGMAVEGLRTLGRVPQQ